MKTANTGFLECDVCGEKYDYAPDSPAHVCRAPVAKVDRAARVAGADDAEKRGTEIGRALAAAILVRDFDQPTHAAEILGAAGLTWDKIVSLQLDTYDSVPLAAVVET